MERLASTDGVTAWRRADGVIELEGSHGRHALPPGAIVDVTIYSGVKRTPPVDVWMSIRGEPSSTRVHEAGFEGITAGETALALLSRLVAALKPSVPNLRPGAWAIVIHNGLDTGMLACRLPEEAGGQVILQSESGVHAVREGDVLLLEDAGAVAPLPLRVHLGRMPIHTERTAKASPLKTYAAIKSLLLSTAKAAGAKLSVPNAMTPERFRSLPRADAMARLLAEGEFDAAAWGARSLGTYERAEAWKLPDEFGGSVIVRSLGWHSIERGDVLEPDFGGMSAAVGVVPMGITRRRGDSREDIFGDSVDEYMQPDVNSHDVFQAMIEYFRMIAREAGCTFKEDR